MTAFTAWIDESIQFGIETLDVAKGEMLALIGQSRGKREAIVIESIAGDISASNRQIHGRELIAQFDDADYYSLIFSGAVRATSGEVKNVIAVEAGSRSGESAFVTQPFQIADDRRLTAAGKPLVGSGGVENVWSVKHGIAQSVSHDAQTPKKRSRGKTRPFDPIRTLDDLAERSIHLALDRMQKGNEVPFLCLVDTATGRGSVIPADPSQGDFIELIERLRARVIDTEDAVMYAVVYFGLTERKGKDVDIVLAQAGQRGGSAPVYGLTFKVSKSLKLTTGKGIEITEEIGNLWE